MCYACGTIYIDRQGGQKREHSHHQTTTDNRTRDKGSRESIVSDRPEESKKGAETMKIKTITDEDSGRRWEIYKRANNQYYYKYYEFFRAIGWRLTGQNGGGAEGYYHTKESIEWEFDTTVA